MKMDLYDEFGINNIHPMIVRTHLISAIDRLSQMVVQSQDDFWANKAASENSGAVALTSASNNRGKSGLFASLAIISPNAGSLGTKARDGGYSSTNGNDATINSEAFTYELNRDTFVLLNNLLQYCVHRLRLHSYQSDNLPIVPNLNKYETAKAEREARKAQPAKEANDVQEAAEADRKAAEFAVKEKEEKEKTVRKMLQMRMLM